MFCIAACPGAVRKSPTLQMMPIKDGLQAAAACDPLFLLGNNAFLLLIVSTMQIIVLFVTFILP